MIFLYIHITIHSFGVTFLTELILSHIKPIKSDSKKNYLYIVRKIKSALITGINYGLQ